MSQPTIDLDESKLEDLQTKVLRDIAGSLGLIMAYMGDRLDLYSALAELGEATSQKLAESTGLDERYVREWLSANAAVGYVNYDSGSSAFSMSPEQFVIFGQEGHPSRRRPRCFVRARACRGPITTAACSAGRSVFSAPCMRPT